jgi:hypothetical protein
MRRDIQKGRQRRRDAGSACTLTTYFAASHLDASFIFLLEVAEPTDGGDAISSGFQEGDDDACVLTVGGTCIEALAWETSCTGLRDKRGGVAAEEEEEEEEEGAGKCCSIDILSCIKREMSVNPHESPSIAGLDPNMSFKVMSTANCLTKTPPPPTVELGLDDNLITGVDAHRRALTR